MVKKHPPPAAQTSGLASPWNQGVCLELIGQLWALREAIRAIAR